MSIPSRLGGKRPEKSGRRWVRRTQDRGSPGVRTGRPGRESLCVKHVEPGAIVDDGAFPSNGKHLVLPHEQWDPFG